MDRTFDLAGKAREQGIGFCRAAEEGHVDAARVILVDQHADMQAALQRVREPHRRIERGCDHLAHVDGADVLHGAVDGGDVRTAKQHRGLEPVGRRGQRRQFPVAEMGREDQRSLAVLDQLVEHRNRRVRQLDAAALRMVRIVVPDAVEMREFAAEASEIVPHLRQDRFDLFVALFRESRAQIGAADPVLAQQRADQSA